MSVYAAMSAAVSGMKAQSRSLGNISDNLANSQTVGFKRVDTNFAELVTNSTQRNHSPGGVIATPRYRHSIQGDLTQTQIATNMAIAGNGFFVVSKASTVSPQGVNFDTNTMYSRRGDFQLDKFGYLVNGGGYYLNGRSVIDQQTLNTTDILRPMRIQADVMQARASARVSYSANLPANAGAVRNPYTNATVTTGTVGVGTNQRPTASYNFSTGSGNYAVGDTLSLSFENRLYEATVGGTASAQDVEAALGEIADAITRQHGVGVVNQFGTPVQPAVVGAAQSNTITFANVAPQVGDTYSVDVNGTVYTATVDGVGVTDDWDSILDALTTDIEADEPGLATYDAATRTLTLTAPQQGVAGVFTVGEVIAPAPAAVAVDTPAGAPDPQVTEVVFENITVSNGETFSVTVAGTQYTHTAAGGEDLDDVLTALVAAINADGGQDVTAAPYVNGTRTLTLTGPTTGAFTASSTSLVVNDYQTPTVPSGLGVEQENTIRFADVALTAGQTVTINVDGTDYDRVVGIGETWDDILPDLEAAIIAGGVMTVAAYVPGSRELHLTAVNDDTVIPVTVTTPPAATATNTTDYDAGSPQVSTVTFDDDAPLEGDEYTFTVDGADFVVTVDADDTWDDVATKLNAAFAAAGPPVTITVTADIATRVLTLTHDDPDTAFTIDGVTRQTAQFSDPVVEAADGVAQISEVVFGATDPVEGETYSITIDGTVYSVTVGEDNVDATWDSILQAFETAIEADGLTVDIDPDDPILSITGDEGVPFVINDVQPRHQASVEVSDTGLPATLRVTGSPGARAFSAQNAQVLAGMETLSTMARSAGNEFYEAAGSFSGGAITVFNDLGTPTDVQFRWLRVGTADNSPGNPNGGWVLMYQDPNRGGWFTADADPNTPGDQPFTFSPEGRAAMSSVTLGIGPTGGQPITLDFTGIDASTQLTSFYADDISVYRLEQDGYQAGVLRDVFINDFGYVVANYDNGRSRVLYQVPLAVFTAPDSLGRHDGGAFTRTPESGDPLVTTMGNGGAGSIVASATENSNVDIADEFIKMIVAQRAYSANSRSVTTADDMLQETINMKR